MDFETEATYEDGVLKPLEPLPLRDHERVTVRIMPRRSLRDLFGSIPWHGDPETLRRIAEDDEFGILASE